MKFTVMLLSPLLAPNLIGVQDIVTTPVPIRAYTPSNQAISKTSPWMNNNNSNNNNNNKQQQFKPSIKESAFFGEII